jgi:hypothetical protein
MRASNLALMICASLALGTASAGAGPCNQEIMDVTKKLAATDAGSGPQVTLGPWPATKKVSIPARR